jgi:AcrR family transcriptional regulator
VPAKKTAPARRPATRERKRESVPAPDSKNARELTKQETREALIRAGMEMFAEHGLDVPSLDALCARAGFTRGAFYVHFPDREAFIVAVMEAATQGFIDAILAARGEALDLAAIVRGFAGAVSGGRFPVFGPVPLSQFLAACGRSKALRKRYGAILLETIARVAEAVRAGQKAGTVRREVDAEKAAGLMVAVALGVGAAAEIEVPFDTTAHAEAWLALLAPR